MPSNPLIGWKVDRSEIRTIGVDLKRPECILADRAGSLWSADARGGVMQILPDGTQNLISQRAEVVGNVEDRLMDGTLPNGLAFATDGSILISNFGTDRLELMKPNGETSVLFDTIDGQPIGKVNFVLRDSKDRVWVTVSTKVNPWVSAMRPGLSDGYIILVDKGRPRIVAENFAFTNEIRFDAREEWLYIAETAGKHISRMKVAPDGSLSDREIFGPESLGLGFPDGITFDAYGNLWVTMIMADRLIAITPDGDVLELLDDGDPQGTAELEKHFAASTVTREVMLKAKGQIAPWLASLTFGGADLQTVYLGSLLGTNIPYFRAPVAGLPMVHWR